MYYQDIKEIIKSMGCVTSKDIIDKLKQDHEQVNEIRIRAVLRKIDCKEIKREQVGKTRSYKYTFISRCENKIV